MFAGRPAQRQRQYLCSEGEFLQRPAERLAGLHARRPAASEARPRQVTDKKFLFLIRRKLESLRHRIGPVKKVTTNLYKEQQKCFQF